MVLNASLHRKKSRRNESWWLEDMIGMNWDDYFTVKRPRRAVICFLIALALMIFWFVYSGEREKPESYIICKSKVLEMIWPSKAEREKQLQNPSYIDTYTLEKNFTAYISHPPRMCYRQKHLGPSDDGGWEICLDGSFDVYEPCLVYSFGIGNDFRFEHAIEEFLECEVHAFDPSMDKASHKYSTRGYFHDIGLGMKDGTALAGRWKIRRLKSIMRELGHEDRTIDYLKMDIEFAEWLALHDMIESGVLNRVRHFSLEIHTPEMDLLKAPKSDCSYNNAQLMRYMLNTLLKLEHLGFSLYHSRANQRIEFQSRMTGENRYCCYDLNFVNTKHPKNREKHKNVF